MAEPELPAAGFRRHSDPLCADLEKEAVLLSQEAKIALPVYKISCAVFFIVLLSLVRGVTDSFEIGIALEAPMAILAAAFCADTYTQEITSKRSEIWRLCPVKKKICAICRRIVIQEMFLFLVAVTGYGLFFVVQDPRIPDMGQNGLEYEICQFLAYAVAVVITLGFWGLLSNLLSCFFQNMWAGIGGCLILWLTTNSSIADRYAGAWNLFSYTFRDAENSSDFSWICGKMVCTGIGMIMMAILPGIIEKRG